MDSRNAVHRSEGGGLFAQLPGARALCYFARDWDYTRHGSAHWRDYVCFRSCDDPAWIDLDAKTLRTGGMLL